MKDRLCFGVFKVNKPNQIKKSSYILSLFKLALKWIVGWLWYVPLLIYVWNVLSVNIYKISSVYIKDLRLWNKLACFKKTNKR